MSEDARPGRSKGQQADLGILDGLVQLSFAIHRVLGRVADAHELSLVQLRLLGILRDREPGMQEIATFLELDKSSVTGLIDRAERRGLVRRASTPDDGRAVRVALTEQGRELTQKCVKQVGRELDTLVEGLTETERKRLSALASQIVYRDGQRVTLDVSYPFGLARSGQSRLRSLSRGHGQTGADESSGVAEAD
ncbi:MAG: MarR family transcriptional regulator [Pseudomonadota bacterium]